MKICYAALFLVFSLSFLAGNALAQAGPPLLTDDAETPGSNHWEINTAVTYEDRPGDERIELPIMDINYGVGDNLQLKVEIPWTEEKTDVLKSFLGELNVGIKWRLVDNPNSGFAMSLYPQHNLDTRRFVHARTLGNPAWNLFLPISAQWSYKDFQTVGEIGYQFQQGGGGWVVGLAGEYVISEPFHIMGEIYSTAVPDFTGPDIVANIGTQYKLSQIFSLLASVGRGVYNTQGNKARFLLYAGIQMNL